MSKNNLRTIKSILTVSILTVSWSLTWIFSGTDRIVNEYKLQKNADNSLKWSITDGIVISSELEEVSQEDSINFQAAIRYKYTVGERNFLSDKLSFGSYGNGNLEDVKLIVNLYKKGEKIKVYYDPLHPSESVLKTGAENRFGYFTTIVIGIFYIGVGAILPIVLIASFLLGRKRTQEIKKVILAPVLTFAEPKLLLNLIGILFSAWGIYVMIGGYCMIIRDYKFYKNAHNSLQWSKINGIVVSSKIEDISFEDSINFKATILYKYSVKEKIFLSDKVSFGSYGTGDLENVKPIVNRYEKGQKITVYYDPLHPNESVLKPGADAKSNYFMTMIFEMIILGFFGVFFTFIGIATLLSPKNLLQRK